MSRIEEEKKKKKCAIITLVTNREFGISQLSLLEIGGSRLQTSRSTNSPDKAQKSLNRIISVAQIQSI